MQSYTVIYALGIRISCCYICTHSMCVFNHAYITYNTPVLHQNTQRYLLLCPHILLRPSILDLSNYLTCYPLFQKNSPLFYSVTAEENRKLDISYQIFWFSLFWTGFISYSRLLPLVRKKLLHGFAQNLRKYHFLVLYSFFPPLPNKHFYIDIDMQASKHNGKHCKSSIHILERR